MLPPPRLRERGWGSSLRGGGGCQSQVQIVQLEFLEGQIERVGDVADIFYDLARHEELLPRDPALLDGSSKLRLRPVNLGTVEVVVTKFDRGLRGLDQGTINFIWPITSFEPSSPCAVSELFYTN